MRRMIVVLAAALSLWGCGGSSTSNGDGGAGGGGGGGACPVSAGTYSTRWTYVSGGAMCMQSIPMDQVSMTDGGMSAGVDAGSSCPLVQNGCSYSLSCNTPIGDAGSNQISYMATVAGDGSVSGTLSYSFTFSFGGQTMMQACAYSFTTTKQ